MTNKQKRLFNVTVHDDDNSSLITGNDALGRALCAAESYLNSGRKKITIEELPYREIVSCGHSMQSHSIDRSNHMTYCDECYGNRKPCACNV